jgi:hypothetical protein
MFPAVQNALGFMYILLFRERWKLNAALRFIVNMSVKQAVAAEA